MFEKTSKMLKTLEELTAEINNQVARGETPLAENVDMYWDLRELLQDDHPEVKKLRIPWHLA